MSELLVSHRTVTRYSSRVEVAYHCAFLQPRATASQQVTRYTITIDPQPSHVANAADSFGNVRTEFALYEPHEQLSVHAESRIVLQAREKRLDAERSTPWDTVASALRYALGGTYLPASEFVFASPYVPPVAALADYARQDFTAGRPYLQAAIALMARIHADYAYDASATEVSTPLLEVFEQRRGVCQDFAHLMIGMLRSLGLPARYVSGYLLTQPRPGQARLAGADASHAWLSIWCPQLGWVDLDPTNDMLPELSHVTVATGRDYGDVMPLRGVIRGGADHALEVAVDVAPLD
jgi:transglutaminase-like putative cysteine protease